MSIVLIFLFFFTGLFGSFFNVNSASIKARDTERKNDINSLFLKLEEHYNNYGEYPTTTDLTLDYDEKLPGLSQDALIDPNGMRINANNADYSYRPLNCTAIGCASYTLSARLETEDTYLKQSLN